MKNFMLDAVDIRILSAVQQHGQVSKTRLSELVNLSPTPCLIRLERLKSGGYITGYRGVIAIDKIVDLTEVWVAIWLKTHNRAEFQRFEYYIQGIDEIVECSAVGGGADYVMKVVTTSLQKFQGLIDELLNQELNIDRYYVYFITRSVKSKPISVSKLMAMKKQP
ncbi:Lrp/AsnC family transcriptional regulator [Marinobacter sp. CHS3-4]|uniref:Lrp/AsnC family transcriptional regulator n=1 Tax=Marinobacter sp. CHS3-4 TaxID=3045174 RepID=UPI0024B549D2|nr:Lrp/AsnC family transcriptional regulator [Marinobacter sp. CHS3-4]MDI9245971.1 Lrp/AsnC family transcriptional regulator [Marinobacter sp. CHS3-4]